MSAIAFVGTYTHDAPDGGTPGQASEGIYAFDTAHTPWRNLGVQPSENPSYLACHPDLPVLYAVNEIAAFDAAPRGAVEAFGITTAPTKLHPLARCALAIGATSPAHVAVATTAEHLIVSAYEGGQFNVLALDETGTPVTVQHVHLLAGQGPDEARQATPHAHHAVQSPDERVWVGCDLGSDRILMWTLEQGHMVLETTIAARPGSGPRHAVFHPFAPHFYVINELDATIDQYTQPKPGTPAQWNRKGAPTKLLSGTGHAQPSGAALVMHPSGRWLYASTRRLADNPAHADSVSAWRIDPESGALTLIGHTLEHINFPREMRLSPGGDRLYVLNQKGGTIMQFDIDQTTGVLLHPLKVVTVPSPASLVFFSPDPLGPTS